MHSTIPDVGDMAPGFTVLGASGEPFHLRNALNRTHNIMLVFYRGHW